MNRFSRLFASALIGAAGLAATALAGGPADSSANGYGHAGWHGFASRHLQKCLASAGVSTEQQAAIDQIQSDSRPAMQTNFAAMKAAEDKLRNDVASNADKSTLGQDVLDKQAVMDKIKADHKDIHDKIFAQLRPEQQSAVESCMQSQSHGPRGGASPSEAPTQ